VDSHRATDVINSREVNFANQGVLGLDRLSSSFLQSRSEESLTDGFINSGLPALFVCVGLHFTLSSEESQSRSILVVVACEDIISPISLLQVCLPLGANKHRHSHLLALLLIFGICVLHLWLLIEVVLISRVKPTAGDGDLLLEGGCRGDSLVLCPVHRSKV